MWTESLSDIDKIRIVQTYHGNGSKEGYVYRVEKFMGVKDEYIYIGDIVNFPLNDRVVSLDGIPYEIVREYDCNDTPEDEINEKVIIELKRKYSNEYYQLKWK